MKSSFFISAIIAFTGLILLNSCMTRPLSTNRKQALSNKVIVITGASSGLGRGVALALADCNTTLVLASRSRPELEEVALLVQAKGSKSLVVVTDVSDETAVQSLAETTLRHLGRIDIWINNAGIAVLGNYWETPLKDQLRVVDVN